MRRTSTLVLLAAVGAVLLSAQSWTEDQGERGTAADLLALGADVEDKVGPPMGPPLDGTALEEQTESLSSVLRCPVCQGLSVSDSPSESARNMKRQIRAMVAAGYDPDQIQNYFVGAYGDFVLMSPPAEGFNLVVWLAPVGLLVIGGLLGLSAFLRRRGPSTPTEAAADEAAAAAPTDPIDPWLERIRSEVAEE